MNGIHLNQCGSMYWPINDVNLMKSVIGKGKFLASVEEIQEMSRIANDISITIVDSLVKKTIYKNNDKKSRE
jgi:phosphopantothenate synthetase